MTEASRPNAQQFGENSIYDAQEEERKKKQKEEKRDYQR